MYMKPRSLHCVGCFQGGEAIGDARGSPREPSALPAGARGSARGAPSQSARALRQARRRHRAHRYIEEEWTTLAEHPGI